MNFCAGVSKKRLGNLNSIAMSSLDAWSFNVVETVGGIILQTLKNRDEDETMVITQITRCLDWKPSLLALPLQFYKLHGIRQRHAALNAKNKSSQQIASNKQVPAHVGDCGGLFGITRKNHKSKIAFGFFRPALCSKERSVWDKLIALRKGHTMLCAYIQFRVRGPSPWSNWNKPTILEQESDKKKHIKQSEFPLCLPTSCEQHGSSSTNAAEYLQVNYFFLHFIALGRSARWFVQLPCLV